MSSDPAKLDERVQSALLGKPACSYATCVSRPAKAASRLHGTVHSYYQKQNMVKRCAAVEGVQAIDKSRASWT